MNVCSSIYESEIQHELEIEASKPEDSKQDAQEPTETKPQSIAQIIYTENRVSVYVNILHFN